MPQFETFTAARNHVEARRLRPAFAARRRVARLVTGSRQPSATQWAAAEVRAARFWQANPVTPEDREILSRALSARRRVAALIQPMAEAA